jgi:hypothetical protein
MGSLARFFDDALEKRQRMPAQIELFHGAASHFDPLQPEAVFTVRCFPDESLSFEHHKEPMDRALMQPETQRELRRAALAGGQSVQNAKRAVEHLNTITSGNHGAGSYQDSQLDG